MPWSIFTDGGGDLVAKGWAEQLLKMIGAPVTPGNVQFVYDWEKSEGGGGKFNPLNQGPVPGQPNLTTTGSQYGGGAADFASWQAGLTGASAYLHMPAYSGVLAALKRNDPVGARSALWASPWAASHYGYGSNWANVPAPGGNAVLPPASGKGGGTQAQVTSAAPNPGCLIPFPTNPLQAAGIGSPTGCLFSRSNARALLGGLLLGVSGAVAFTGVALLAAAGFKRTGALAKAADVAAVVPGGQGVAAGLHTASRGTSGRGAAAARERARSRRETQRRARREAERRKEEDG